METSSNVIFDKSYKNPKTLSLLSCMAKKSVNYSHLRKMEPANVNIDIYPEIVTALIPVHVLAVLR